MSNPLKIAIGVHGRFHAFDVARALTELGQEVTLFTNYPSFAKKRFGIEHISLISFALHGAITRGLGRIGKGQLLTRLEPWLHQSFGRWLAHEISKCDFDVLNVYSGVAEETLEKRSQGHLSTVCVLERASTHIRTQQQLLAEETTRTNSPIDAPSPWMIEREEREYQMAEQINVLSSFCQNTFLKQGFSADRLTVTPLGVNTSQFRANPEWVNHRTESILSNAPLRVIYVGQVSFRKGLWDIEAVVRGVPTDSFEFTLVGTVLSEAKAFVARFPANVNVVGHQPQASLPEWYQTSDIFLFPTIEDGFPVVLAQAQAAGLPIIATTNCSAPDFIEEGKSGWIVPIRAPDQIVEKLEWCNANRSALAEMVRYTYKNPYVRDWLDVGRDYLTLMQRLVAER